jgi:hypothetical protein
MAERILKKPPKVGYLTISNALQWRLQYGRIVMLKEEVEGIVKVVLYKKYYEVHFFRYKYFYSFQAV